METLLSLLNSILLGNIASTLINGLSESMRGHICEAIVRISVSLHIHPKNAGHVDGLIPDPKNKRLLPIDDTLTYLQNSKINNSSATGKIDAAWIHNKRIILASSKIKNTIGSLDDLDVTYLLDSIRQEYLYDGVAISSENVDVCVFVLDKKHVLDKVRSATTNVIKNSLNDNNIYDIADLDALCRTIQARVRGESDPVGSLIGDSRNHISLRFHQELICTKAQRVLASKTGTKILVGAIPRSGKTYIGAKLCSMFSRVLIVTTRPSETKQAWIDVFREHREFSGYNIAELTNKNEHTVCLGEGKLILVASKQFFDHSEERKTKTSRTWDLILIDEIHEGGCTDLFVNVLNNNTAEHTHHIMMTATYDKPIMRFNIPSENQFYWDLEDVRLMKNWSRESELRLVEKYGPTVVDVKNQFEAHSRDISGHYTLFPDVIVLTTTMQEDYYRDMVSFNLTQDDSEVGFSMRALFMITKDGKAFQNPNAVKRFLELVSGSANQKSKMSMFDRIRRVWNTRNHRDNDPFMTMMWFLPFSEGQKIADVKRCLAKLISQNPVLKNYNVMCLDSGTDDIKNKVKYAVEDARIKDGKDGLILLTGDVGSLGVSLPEVDIVFMLNNTQSSDKIFQQMLRCMTEHFRKKCGIVVDFNVWRVLNTLSTYAMGRCGKVISDTKDKIRWCITNLTHVDVDLWECPDTPYCCTKDSLIEKLSMQWTRMMENSGVRLAALQRQVVDIGDDQLIINKFGKFTASPVAKDKREIPDGISETRSEDSSDESVKSQKKKELPKNININDILARLIPEIALLSGGHRNLQDALMYIDSVPSKRDAMNEYMMKMCES
jgi:hypothetical protein